MVSINRHWIFNPTDAALLAMQGDGCFYCGKALSLAEATRDHLTPRKMGRGAPLTFNKVMACLKCNQRKAAKPPTDLDKEKTRNLYANCGLPRFGVI